MHEARGALLAVLHPVMRRMRWRRALRGAWMGLHVGLGGSAALLWGAWLRGLPLPWHWAVSVSCGAVILGFAGGGLWPVRVMEAARRMDAAGGLCSRLATAVEGVWGAMVPLPAGASLAGGDRAFLEAAVRDAIAAGRAVDPRVAVPWTLSSPGWTPLPLALLVVVAWLWPSPFRRVQRAPAGAVPEVAASAVAPARLLDAEEREAFEAEGRELAQGITDPALRELAGAYERLLERMARGEVDRAEVLRQLDALSRRAVGMVSKDEEAMREALRGLREDLRTSGPLRPVAEALERRDPAAAAEAMRRQAERLRQGELSRDALRRLREQLRRLAEREERIARALARNERSRRRLLRNRDQEASRGAGERRLLRRRERQLQRLQRERERLEAARRTLQRLRREAARGARALSSGDRNAAADALRSGSEELDRAGSLQQRREQREALRRLMRTLREAVQRHREREGRSGARGSGGRRARLRRFTLRAGGRTNQGADRLLLPGGDGRSGREGGRSPTEGSHARGGSVGPGRGGEGQGREGDSTSPQGRTFRLGGGGEPEGVLEVPGMARSARGGAGREAGGSAAGEGSGSGALPRPTPRSGRHRDVRVRGEGGAGPTRAQTIEEAADRGFVVRGYQRVYEDYRDHAERVLEREEVPPGHRFYVRRYFLLIRPRAGGDVQKKSEEP